MNQSSKISKIGSLLGRDLLRLGREPFDLEFDAKKKSGNYPYLPEKAPMKYYVRRDFVTSAEIISDIENPKQKLVKFNGDSSLIMPVETAFTEPNENVIADILRFEDPKTLDSLFFEKEEGLVALVTQQNKRTIAHLDATTSYIGEIITGLTAINKSTIAAFEENKD